LRKNKSQSAIGVFGRRNDIIGKVGLLIWKRKRSKLKIKEKG